MQEHGIRLVAIEVAQEDMSYNYPSHGIDMEGVDHFVCFPKENYHYLKAEKVHKKVYELLVAQNVDVVFAPATAFPEGMAAILYRTLHRKKAILMDDAWERTDRKGALTHMVKRAIHRNVDAALVPASSHAGHFNSMGFPDERIFTGLDVVDNELFAADAKRARAGSLRLRETYGLPDKYFLFVGRLLPRKGLDALIEAYEEQYIKTNGQLWPLVIVGDGPFRENLEALTASKPYYLLKGPMFGMDLRNVYALASCFVMPSYSDPWGLVLNEAMASGLPVIASTGCGATGNLVRDGMNGWTYEPQDTHRLGELISTASRLTDDDLSGMGEYSEKMIAQWPLSLFAKSVLRATQIERRKPAGIISDFLTRRWKGRVSLN